MATQCKDVEGGRWGLGRDAFDKPRLERCSEIGKINSNLTVIGKTNIVDNDKEDFDNEAEDDDVDNGEESEGDDFDQETG
nr:transcription termination factor 4, mitochondrial [Ipomoea batatas]GMC75646.1 transcription termination factor 4, mitochondrial [Ipomoea batatas]GMD86416.1 transcription termination factor 4, mitochondrial [Ipomoea batatas]GME01343.1 transcription termination factor 4, mitochondrial [Ipomoea batatas]